MDRGAAQAAETSSSIHPNQYLTEGVLGTAWRSLSKDSNRHMGVQARASPFRLGCPAR